MPRQRADPHDVGLDGDVAEFAGQVIDVDQTLGGGEPEFHHRQKAVPTRDDPGFLAAFVQ